MTKKYTTEELDKEFPDWRSGRSGSGRIDPSNRTARRKADPAAERFAALLHLLKELLDLFDSPIRLEYKFDKDRKWRADLAILPLKILVEFEGGVYAEGGGAHQRVKRFRTDMEKYNAATAAGWRVYRMLWEKVLSGEVLQYLKEQIAKEESDDS